MKKSLLLFFILLGLLSNAQINFLNHNVIDISYCIGSVNNVIPFDMDNDGDLDMISSSNTKYIVWQENLDGLGNYGNIRLITDQLDGITSISLADIDNDSDMDIVSTALVDNSSTGQLSYGTIAWHENLGQGNFTMHLLAQNVTNSRYAKAGDMDGDGDMDIVATTNSGTLAWFKNINGLGTFSTALSVATTGLALVSSLDIADADGDGDNDIVVTSSLTDQYMKAGLFKNTNGLGSFSAFQLLRSEAPEINYSIITRVMFQDLDNDGDMDILFTANNKFITLKNSGSGTYSVANVIFSGYIRDRFRDFTLKDMDNDGDLDVVAAMFIWQAADKVLWFENNSTHSYTTSHIIQNATYDGITAIEIADIDGDNINDIVTGNYSNNYLVWYKNYTDIKLLGKFCYNPADVQTADIDNDGDLDMITTAGSNEKIVWYGNTDGAGTTGLQKVITFADNCYGYKLNDIDGDGAVDIAIDGKWFKNDGFGNFTPNIYVDLYAGDQSIVYIEDVDNDGHNDLIAVDNLSNGNAVIGWYKNVNGLGSFGPRQSIVFVSGISIGKIVFTDIDGDGDKDIVYSGGKIGIVKNLDGAGTFSTSVQTVYGYTAGTIFCGDFDGDGDQDILSADVYENSNHVIGLFKNTNGLGNFSSYPQIVSYSNLTGAFPADMDNDGDLDIISNLTYGFNTVWLENLTGLGVFGQPVSLVANPESNETNNAADIDNDGKVDILYSTNYAGKYAVSWFKNNGLSLNKITGIVKLDLNHNGCDNLDNPMSNVKVVTQSANGDTFSTFTASNGYYQIYLPNPGAYTTSVESTLPSYFSFTPSSYVTTFTGNNSVQALDFCLTDNATVNDLDVQIYPTSAARPGFPSSYVLIYHNKGTTPLSGNVKLQFNAAKMSFTSASALVDGQTANELTFNFTNINPFETRMINMNFQIFTPPAANINEVLPFTGTINPIIDDATPTDNIFQFNQTLRGAYDPNDITVLEGESIFVDQIDDYLHYVIRFQNTGTASAINITVTNTLDQGLDWNTLQIDGASHNNYVAIRNGNQMSFIFRSIYLPYSAANEPASHGFICYKIKPKSNSAVGDLFHNEAQIYFDYNTAIHTNVAVTEVLNPLGINNYGANSASLYPNPTTGKIHISGNFEIKSLSVYNIYGQKICGVKNDAEIDLSDCSAGFYFISIEDTAGKIMTKKVLKR